MNRVIGLSSTRVGNDIDHSGRATIDGSERALDCGAEVLRVDDWAFAVHARTAWVRM
jgi:hypothetical protein